jgi:hypothetical protein
MVQLFSRRNKQFFSHFEDVATSLTEMSSLFAGALTGDRQLLTDNLAAMEQHERTVLSHVATLRSLSGNSLFIPLDREDIHFLTSDLKFFAGNMLHIVKQLKTIRPAVNPETTTVLAEKTATAFRLMCSIVSGLKDVSKLSALTTLCADVKNALYHCDALLDHATADILNTCKDPIELIKITDHFSAMQHLLEKAGDIINVCESVIVKYS